jgi:hypothetical protein
MCPAHVVRRHLSVAESRQPGMGDGPAAGAAGPRPMGNVPRSDTVHASAVGSTGRCGSWQQLRDAESELLEPHWDAGVYSRVFLSEAAAQAWYAWNSLRGDPAQPFHYQHLLVRLQQQVSREAGMLTLGLQVALSGCCVSDPAFPATCSSVWQRASIVAWCS